MTKLYQSSFHNMMKWIFRPLNINIKIKTIFFSFSSCEIVFKKLIKKLSTLKCQTFLGLTHWGTWFLYFKSKSKHEQNRLVVYQYFYLFVWSLEMNLIINYSTTTFIFFVKRTIIESTKYSMDWLSMKIISSLLCKQPFCDSFYSNDRIINVCHSP